MMVLLQIFSAFIGVVGFAIALEVQKKYLFHCGIAGALGWAAYLFGQNFLPIGGMFFSSFVIAWYSQVYARKLHCPVTVILIPAVFPTVPGASMYRTVYSIIMGQNDMAGHYFLETLTIAGMIALGIYMVEMIYKLKAQIEEFFR